MNTEIIRSAIEWWQHLPYTVNPVFFKLGPVSVHYYGLCYLLSFLTVYVLLLKRLRNQQYRFPYSKATIESFFMWAIFGVLLGGRLGYVVFYKFGYYLSNPLEVILPFSFQGGVRYTGISGMSYHGGLIGLIVATILFCRIYGIGFWKFSDLVTPAVPLGYTFGRLGNFINGELFGRATEKVWGMYFPLGGDVLRHPSQLYEAFFEGLFLFIIFWSLKNTSFLKGKIFLLYMVGYGLVRFVIEFFREPDEHLGFILGSFTMGQVLCGVMVLFSLLALWIKTAIGQSKST